MYQNFWVWNHNRNSLSFSLDVHIRCDSKCFRAHHYRSRFITFTFSLYESCLRSFGSLFSFFYTMYKLCRALTFFLFPFFLSNIFVQYVVSCRTRNECLFFYDSKCEMNRRGLARILNHSTFSCKYSCVTVSLSVRVNLCAMSKLETPRSVCGYQIALE